MHAFHTLVPIIALLAVIQSVFGMGILVFGTPTLLLLGYDFATVLGWLLPASMSVSAIQVWSARRVPLARHERGAMVSCGVIAMLSLAFLLYKNIKAGADVLIGLILLSAAAIRYSSRLQSRLRVAVCRHRRMYVAVMGVVHGLTNMGGALLAVYAASSYGQKEEVRAAVARYYLMFGAIQLCALAVLRRSALSCEGIAMAPVAGIVYFAAGNMLFQRAAAPLYERALTAFIGFYGAVVLSKAFI